VRLCVLEAVVAVQRGLLVLRELAVGLALGASLSCSFVYGSCTPSSDRVASASGAKLTFVPNMPVLIAAHSGSPLSRSR